MARVLVHVTTAPGHLFPLVPGLLELGRRGHDVQVRVGAELVGVARDAGLDAVPTDPRIDAIPVATPAEETGPNGLRRALGGLMARGPAERADLTAAIETFNPDVVLVDINAYGAAVAAEAAARAGGPRWATTLPSLLPLRGAGIPPYGLGLAPARGPLGRLRDRALWPVVIRQFGKAMLPPLNLMRAEAGLAPLASPFDHVLTSDRLLVLTGDPLEYPRADLPESVRFVGAQQWDPPAETPDWLAEPGAPWVLVTTSTDYQGDERLAEVAVEALRGELVGVLVTLGGAYDTARLESAGNVRVERFVPHGPVLAHAAAVVCHGGMGITQKAIAAGVPVVAVPFGRDQPEVARRVAEAGAGLVLPAKRLTADRLRAAVHAAIEAAPAARAAAERMRANGGPDRLADAVEELAAPCPAPLTGAAR
ncbi:nucleotide disphospho-sugar-binding domain-containing protein [Pseudofrankia sp. EUN1h]|uniref:nucleotide disphospho-sugar-binding domain-containing protein n=1 Tax=Pseudofrankia sp. EUN1h TaxID=1834515 RepID=UPI0008DA3CB3|nr:nucleotide disphospho-sugar-binding domain-containing protein [Pseudofrankia sp. EUN1h]OHV31568.1 glycosyltransferase [Pseudofrankia sp. EUN1h]